MKRPKILIPLLVFIFILLVLISIVKNMNQPAIGSISQQPPAQTEKTDPYASPGTYKGKYITFSYPAHYKKVPSALSGAYLEVVDYHTTDSTGKQINVGIYPGNFDTDSAIQYRRQHKELYKENESNYGLKFTKSDGTEDTFFIEHKNLLASVSATAPYNNQAGDAQFVASSLKWR
jgi:hypothetical protein